VVAEEISDCIKHLKDGSSGHDQIKPEIIKYSREALLNPVTYIFNLSIEQGHVPSALKKANITPVFKSGDPQFANNYRPVLPTFNKILERLIFNRLYKFIEDTNII
ncbi:hypothetical protein CAPTEDRAFT_40174, partial [Capitella teleta]